MQTSQSNKKGLKKINHSVELPLLYIFFICFFMRIPLFSLLFVVVLFFCSVFAQRCQRYGVGYLHMFTIGVFFSDWDDFVVEKNGKQFIKVDPATSMVTVSDLTVKNVDVAKELAALKARIASLESQVAALKAAPTGERRANNRSTDTRLCASNAVTGTIVTRRVSNTAAVDGKIALSNECGAQEVCGVRRRTTLNPHSRGQTLIDCGHTTQQMCKSPDSNNLSTPDTAVPTTNACRCFCPDGYTDGTWAVGQCYAVCAKIAIAKP